MSRLTKFLQAATGWATVIATAVSPFAPSLYDHLASDDFHFVYSYRYIKNPVLEWNRQVSVALRRLNQSIKDEGDLPKSLLKGLTKELMNNAPALAAYADIRPFDSVAVQIVNVSTYDLKDVRVIFAGCSGYDSHTTLPDTLASPESPEKLRSTPDPKTITYRKINRRGTDTYYQGIVTYYGADTSQCQPVVMADLDNGKSGIGRQEDINNYIANRRAYREAWTSAGDITFKLGLLALALYALWHIRLLRNANASRR